MSRIRPSLKAQLRCLLIAAAILSGASLAAEPAASKVPAGLISEYGFEDIDLPITNIMRDPGLTRIVARGEIRRTVVGFEVDFPSEAKRSDQQAPISFGTAQIRSLGVASNSFVALLARLYKVPAPSKTMLPSIRATVAGLQGDPAHVLDGVTMMKFYFFDSGPETRYAEVYINVDPNKRVLQFHEKDAAYRKPLLLALTEP